MEEKKIDMSEWLRKIEDTKDVNGVFGVVEEFQKFMNARKSAKVENAKDGGK